MEALSSVDASSTSSDCPAPLLLGVLGLAGCSSREVREATLEFHDLSGAKHSASTMCRRVAHASSC